MQSQYDAIISQIIKAKRATPEQIQEIQMSSLRKRTSFPRQLIAENIIGSSELLAWNHQYSNYPVVDLREILLSQELMRKADEKMVRKYAMLPVFERSGRLFVATYDPFDSIGLDAFKYSANYSAAEPLIVGVEQLEQMIEDVFAGRGDIDDLFANDAVEDEAQKQKELEELSKLLMGGGEEEEAPVVKYVSEMLLDAIRTGASDLHFEPYEHTYRVRFRKDGVLREISTPPANIRNRITARLKVMSGMDIAEKRVPQDGRIKLPVSESKVIDFRVNTLPTLWGEKIVLRILDGSAAKLNIEMLGFTDQQKALYLDAIKKPQGLVLVTGPTGSGKTVSLYTGLNILNEPTVNISTAEDPVEITLPGVNQVNIIAKQGMTFASALRAFLRQDPDIIMVGEIRDLETAEIAIKAAQTGHMVLSTLHTNDVPQTITRLGNMGVPAYNIAASVELIMAQRLVRRLCSHCKTRDRSWTEQQLVQLGFSEDEADEVKIYAPKGCDRCGGQGYAGRAGVYQVVKITPAMSEMIMNGASSIDLAEQCAKEGFWDLRQSGLDKVRKGITSIQEILRVTVD
ncbi:type IV-A pilus assembly ATPase PilB [Ostreibacterium oceani]|uniref:Type IV-A pilus assembly ATPase PilB n=1 Tax=Ostreibacterium oceani TaxID=2654998 RepID=A0A6N7F2E5_9GAMM|nr:type IV-A pilus assembly ATPase PilB [Ostreibacterium oceani]MPV86968.1 type IV-A pilus assembly ATPase PilB [Ostreibacterium oceani]